jgi:hypothetical protein
MAMATRAGEMPNPGKSDDRFFRNGAIAMTLVIIAGFSLNTVMGRSSFAAAPLVYAHTLVFMGKAAVCLAQNILPAGGHIALHRSFGWLAAARMLPMPALGLPCQTCAG